MKLISHRGNVSSVQTERENTKEYIDEAIDEGFDVEIDVWKLSNYDDVLWLGHDKSEQEIDLDWLSDRRNNLWVHAKNFMALEYLLKNDIKVFYHQKEEHVVIGNTTKIWSHNITEAGGSSIIPLLSKEDIDKCTSRRFYGICSDYVQCLK